MKSFASAHPVATVFLAIIVTGSILTAVQIGVRVSQGRDPLTGNR